MNDVAVYIQLRRSMYSKHSILARVRFAIVAVGAPTPRVALSISLMKTLGFGFITVAAKSITSAFKSVSQSSEIV